MPLITAAQIARVASKAIPHVVNAIVDHADDVLPRYGIVTPLRVQHFLAQILVESTYFTKLEEGLSYSAERAHEVFPRYFPTAASAEPYAHQPEKFANYVYGGRLGNTKPGDGYAHRGLGLMQNTGGNGRARLAKVLHVTPDAVTAMLTDPRHMLECAVADFVALGCLPYADRDDVVGVTKRINGGTNGLADRRRALALCRKVWPRVTVPSPAKAPPPPSLAPPIPSPIAKSTVKQTTFLAFVLSLLGITAASATTIDATPLIDAGINYILVPVLSVTVPTIAALLVMPFRRFLDQKTANLFKDNVNDWLDKAISAGAKQAEAYTDRADFHASVDGWVASLAAQYAVKQAPGLAKKVGDLLADKIQARLSAHEDVLALKASVPIKAAA